jgi:hypothetical protein
MTGDAPIRTRGSRLAIVLGMLIPGLGVFAYLGFKDATNIFIVPLALLGSLTSLALAPAFPRLFVLPVVAIGAVILFYQIVIRPTPRWVKVVQSIGISAAYLVAWWLLVPRFGGG